MRAKSAALFSLALALFGVAAVASGQTSEPWPQNDPEKLAAGPAKETILYGRKLFNETYSVIGPEVRDTSMRYSGNNLSCQNCHLQGGTQKFALPMVGVYSVFPQYMGRENEVRTIEERIQGCMERSMNGRELPLGGKEMKALVAYIQLQSTGIPIGKATEGRGSPNLPLLARAADPKRGAAVYMDKCSFCHQENGQGQRKGAPGEAAGYVYPPLWGPDSFNDGAGMHRVIASASFIRANMPFGTHYDKPELSVEDAWDVAAYINSQPRPRRDHLDADYPNRARKPVDAPFPPYTDKFPPEQHKYGPFQPLLDAQNVSAQAPR